MTRSRSAAATAPLWPPPEGRLPRNAKGEYGRWQGGGYFAPGQGEEYSLAGPDATIDAAFCVVELEDGRWLAGCCCWDHVARYPDRATALKVAVDAMAHRIIMAAIGYAIGGKWYPPQTMMSHERARAIIAWGCEIAGIPPIPLPARHSLAPPPPPPPPPAAQGDLFPATKRRRRS